MSTGRGSGNRYRALLPRLDQKETYLAVIAQLTKKWTKRRRLDRLAIGELTLVELRGQSAELSALLAKTVASGQYSLSPLLARRGLFDGKQRTIYRPNLLDAIVLTVLAQYLSQLFEPELSPLLHSYRKGHSSWKALALLRKYLVDYRRGAATPEERGLYVITRDVNRYGESIDTTDDSPLIGDLARLLANDPVIGRRLVAQPLIMAALRQPVITDGGEPNPLDRGIPTGSPIQPPFANLYLSDIDRQFGAIPGGHYSRFGDDILFVHPDPNVILEMSAHLDARLADLKLSSKAEKRQDLYFNAAGRPSPYRLPFRSTQSVEYLGASVTFAGTLGLKQDHFSQLLRHLSQRLRRVSNELRGVSRDEHVQLLCQTTRRALDPRDLLALPGADRVRAQLNDRSQMKDFDYRIALLIAELVTGRRGVRSFRELSRQTQRKLGAYSLVAAKRRSHSTETRPQ